MKHMKVEDGISQNIVDFPSTCQESFECMELESRVVDALGQDQVLLNSIDTSILEQSFSKTVHSDFV